MPKFAANLSTLFTDLPFLERFAAARSSGFRGVECLFPYDYEEDELAAKLRDLSLKQVLHNLPAGDWSAGERGIAVLPHREQEFRTGVARAVKYATKLDCDQLNCLAGIRLDGIGADLASRTLIANLRFAANSLKAAGMKLLIEPINTRDIPGFYLNGTKQVADIITEVGADTVYIQYDVYHMQIVEGDLAETIRKYLLLIAHIQVADNPGRHEPGTGEVNFVFFFRFLDEIGYDGGVGCEYSPRGKTVDGLSWFAAASAAE